MPSPIIIELEPDNQFNASLKGSDYGDSIVKSASGAKITYEVTDCISVHGHATLNHKRELASLVTFKIEASGPRDRPVKKVDLDLVFEDGDGSTKPDPELAPRIIKLLPGRVGYKVECTEGTQKIKRVNEITPSIEAGIDPVKVGIEYKHGKEKEVERKVEFYSYVRGTPVPSDVFHIRNNCAKLELTGDIDKDGNKNSGVPPVVEIAILLMRYKDGPFHCEADIKVKVDARETISNILGWKKVRANPKIFDVTAQEQPKDAINLETLELYNDAEDKHMKDLVNIRMPVYYEKWKFEKA
jgi:hypothetical protein